MDYLCLQVELQNLCI